MDFNPFVYLAFLKQIRGKQWNSYFKKYSTAKSDDSFAFNEVVQVFGKSSRVKKGKVASSLNRTKNGKATLSQIKSGKGESSRVKKEKVTSNQIKKKNCKVPTYLAPSKVRRQKEKPNLQNKKLKLQCLVKVIDIMKDKSEIIKQGVSFRIGSYVKVCTPSNRQNDLKLSTLMSDSNNKHSQTINGNNIVNISEKFSKRTRKKSEKENLPPKVHSSQNSINNIMKDKKFGEKTECASLKCRRSLRLLNKNLRLNCVAVATNGLTYCADCMNNKGEISSALSCRHKLSNNKENSTLETDIKDTASFVLRKRHNSSLKDDIKLEEPLQEIINTGNAGFPENKILKSSNKNLKSSRQNKPVKDEIMLDSFKLEDEFSTRLCKKRKLYSEDNIKEVPGDKIKNENSEGTISIRTTRSRTYTQRLLTQPNNVLKHKEKMPKEEMLVENDSQGMKRTRSLLVTNNRSKSFSGKLENSEINTPTKRSRSSLQNKTGKPKQQMFIIHTFFKKDLEKEYPDLMYKSKTRPSENFSFALRTYSTTGTRKSLRNRGYSNSDEDFELSKAEISKIEHSTLGTRKSLRNRGFYNSKEGFEPSKVEISNIEHSTEETRNSPKSKGYSRSGVGSEQNNVEISKNELDNKTILSENPIQQSEVSNSDTSNTMQSISLDNSTSSSSTNESSSLLMVNEEIMQIKDLLENDLKSKLGYKVFKRYQSQLLAKENKENDYRYWHQAVKEELTQISKRIPLNSLQGYMNWSINNYINSSSV